MMWKLALILFVAATINAGVDIEIIKEGKLPMPKPGQKVTVHYTLTLQNGQKIDSSRDRGVPFEFIVGKGEVISGWDEGIQKMFLGSRVKVTIPPAKAYGNNPPDDSIPKGATLIFDIELLKIDGKSANEDIRAPQEDVNKPPNPQAPAQPPAVAQAEGNQDQKQLSDGEAANKVMEQTENELYNKVKALESEIEKAQNQANKETFPSGVQ